MKNVKSLKSFEKLPFLRVFLVKKYINTEYLDNSEGTILGVTVGPFIFLSDKALKLEKKYRNFVVYHEIGHVRQFYFSLGIYHIAYYIPKLNEWIRRKLDENADKYAEKMTGIPVDVANSYFENNI